MLALPVWQYLHLALQIPDISKYTELNILNTPLDIKSSLKYKYTFFFTGKWQKKKNYYITFMNEITVSIAMPAYNEIRFIEDTLRSVVNEADEIIIGDNCSTDGTSEIIAEYTKKYPHIKHFRHKENIGSVKNFSFILEQCTGEYIRFIGAHDLISKNSTKSMLKVFEEHPDAVLVYSKNCLHIDCNQNPKLYSLNYDITCDKVFDRLFLCTTFQIYNFATFYAMWPRNTIEKTKKFWCFEKSFTDCGIYFAALSIGKAYCDNESTFYARDHHDDKTEGDTSKRYQNAFNLSVYAWRFANLLECYSVLEAVRKENEFYCDNFLNRLLHAFMFCRKFDISELKKELQEKNVIREDKKAIANDLLKKISEYKFVEEPNLHANLIDYYKQSIPDGYKIKKHIIFGAGDFGRKLSEKFKGWEIDLDYLCDNNLEICNTKIRKTECISFDELKKYADEALIFVSPKNADEIYEQLERNGFKFVFPYTSILKNI